MTVAKNSLKLLGVHRVKHLFKNANLIISSEKTVKDREDEATEAAFY